MTTAGTWSRLARGFLVILLTAVGPAHAQSVRWEPDFRFPGTFFPSFAISSAGKDEKGPTETAATYGFTGSGSFGVRLLEAPPGTRIKAQIEISDIGVSGEIELPNPSDGKAKLLIPRLSWNQARLASIAQPVSSEVVFRLYADGTLVGEQKRPVRIRATNDAPLRACRAPDQCTDYSSYLAAFVNENHPQIDTILRQILDIPGLPVKSWNGTQGTPEDALRQVWAIWYYFQRGKVTYSDINAVSEQRSDVFSQTVRPLSQAIRTSQANCVDGTALFASILRKIGIEPIIVLIPGHAFLGFYTDAQQSKPMFLETTMLNSESNPFHKKGPTQLGTSLAKAFGTDSNIGMSQRSFNDALAEGQQKFDKASAQFGKTPGYVFLPVKKARQSGILPLPL